MPLLRTKAEQGADLDGWLEPLPPGPWKRSRRGNLYRRWNNQTLTIFQRDGDERFAFCIADGDGPHYSRRTYASEDDALSALNAELESLS